MPRDSEGSKGARVARDLRNRLGGGSRAPRGVLDDVAEDTQAGAMGLARFPPVGDTASGMPCPSTMRWCLLPGRARSSGLGPLWGPAGPRGRARNRSPPGTGSACPSTAASPAAPRGAGPGRRPRPMRPAAAGRSCPSRSPAPAAGTPTGCRCAGRTGSRTGPAGPAPAAVPRPALAPARATTARSATTVHPTRSTAATDDSPRPDQRADKPTVT